MKTTHEMFWIEIMLNQFSESIKSNITRLIDTYVSIAYSSLRILLNLK